MNSIVVIFGMFLIQGASVAEAGECGQRKKSQIQELQQLIAELTGRGDMIRARRPTTGALPSRVTPIRRALTTTGAVFTQVAPVHRDFGESWRDPSGMIWGDIAKKEDGSIYKMSHREATEYCEIRGGELPSAEDFIRLREYMGAHPGTNEGYTRQVLPNLKDERPHGADYFFWSSSAPHAPNPSDPDYHPYEFNGGRGNFIAPSRYSVAVVFGVPRLYSRPASVPVRCVARHH